jgi:hypothetical protein
MEVTPRQRRPIIDPIRNFVQLERVLAAILVLTPVLLLGVDDGPDGIRGSISSYHDLIAPEAFYVPLTVAAMLFVVNGLLKAGHWYNWVVGVLLAVLVAFDHDGASKYPHFAGAIGFFVGNVAVMIWFSKHKPRPLIVAFVGTIVVSVGLWLTTDWFTLFWAEWVSLAIVATHYILDTIPFEYVRYTALTEGDAPQLIVPNLAKPSSRGDDELQPAVS